MIKAAEKLGFTAKGVRAQPEALTMIPLPAVAHVQVKNQLLHFVVIYKVKDEFITYMDPADGDMHKVKKEEFLKMWTGVLVIMEPNETFRQGKETKSNFSKFVSLLAPHKSVMIQALFGALICSILGLSTSIYVGKITDYVLVDENLNLLNMMSVVMLMILVLQVSSTRFDALERIPVRETAREWGYDSELYESGNEGVVIGDFGEKARRLFESGKISEGHYNELMNMLYGGAGEED